jgi:F-type H+-transporting ATPase subunit b
MMANSDTRAWLAGLLLAAGILANLVAAPAVGWAATDPASAEVSASGDLDDAHHPSDAAQGEGAHATGTPNPLVIDPDLLLYTAASFLLLLVILGKFAWQPIIQAIDRREKTVSDQLAAAHAAQRESERLLAEHQQQLAGTADQIRQMLEQGRREAEQQKQMIVNSAQQAAADEKKRAVSEITAAKNSALRELAERSVDSALGLAGKIVRRQLQPSDHAELVQEALRDFPSQN